MSLSGPARKDGTPSPFRTWLHGLVCAQSPASGVASSHVHVMLEVVLDRMRS